MVEVLGGALMMLGGAGQAAASFALLRAGRTAIQQATGRFGDATDALPPAPADMTELLARLDGGQA